MADIESIGAQIRSAIAELNLQLSPEQQLGISSDSRLFGDGGPLDSLGLVNLLVLTEERISNEFGLDVTLLDEQVEADQSPFRTVQTFTDYVSTIVENTTRQTQEAHRG
jgi:acyl carrier protein